MIREVRVAQRVYERAHDRRGETRSTEGAPSEYDFVSGPIGAAVLVFRDFENLAFDVHQRSARTRSSIRSSSPTAPP